MPIMSLFRSKHKKFVVSERDPTYRVKYLGNVQTALMKGDGCADKPTGILWNNFIKTMNPGIEMKLTICASGLKAKTKEQGLTEYRAHRITYCIAHPKYPKLFVWVYRHEGKKMKVELRCHAVLCKSDEKAKAMAVQLHDKLSSSLAEFMREKRGRQNTRLTLQRTNSMPASSSAGHGISGVCLRKKFLSTGGNFKPPIDRSPSAPKLGMITEDLEEEVQVILEEEDEEENAVNEDVFTNVGEHLGDSDPQIASHAAKISDLSDGLFDLEIGNDVEALKRDERVRYHLTREDSDDDSSESGYSEQDAREAASNGSTGSNSDTDGPFSLETITLEHSYSNMPDASDVPDLGSTLTLDDTSVVDSNDNISSVTANSLKNGVAAITGHVR